MLDDNEPPGLESFEATEVETLEDGTRLSKGPWKPVSKGDGRHCVLVEPRDGKPLVYWGTPKVESGLEARHWPEVSRARTEREANGFKRMGEHGARDINADTQT